MTGDGERCDGLLSRFAARCSEFRGLQRFETSDGSRWFCWRHLDQGEAQRKPFVPDLGWGSWNRTEDGREK